MKHSSQIAAPSHRPTAWWMDVALLLACFICFAPGLSSGFSDFDDHGFVLEPTFWRGLSPGHLGAIFSTFRLGHYQPLTYLSYAIEYALFGLNPAVFHGTSIVLHALCAILLRRLIGTVLALGSPSLSRSTVDTCALIAAGVWAIHPLRVESVVWITERRDVLSGVFLLGAMLAYFNSATPGNAALRSPRAYWWSVGLLLLSLLSKAWGITFVAIALAADVFPLSRLPLQPWRWARREYWPALAQKLPFVGLGVLFAIIAALAQRGAADETVKSLGDWGISERICQAAYGLVFYVRKTILPAGLAALYELPSHARPTELRFLASFAALAIGAALLLWAALKKGRTGIACFVAFAAYAAIVSPVLGLTQAGIQLVADRYSYLSTIPLFMLAAAGLAWFVQRPALRPRVMIVVAILTLVLGASAFTVSSAWRDTRTLWERAFAAGQDGPVLRNYHGRQLEKAKDFVAAETEYRASIALAPNYGDSWLGLGNSLRAQRKLEDALAAYSRAAATMSDPTVAHIARGMVRVTDQARADLAIPEFAAAVETLERLGNPLKVGGPYLLLAAAYGQSGDDAKAVEWLRRAAEFDDTRAQAEEHLRDMGALR